MVTFYKHEIPPWMDDTEQLSDGAYRAYHVICQLIYLNEGPIHLNELGIAGRCKQSIRAFRANLKELLAAKKVVIVDGLIDNSCAEEKLEKIRSNRENGRTGGEASGKSRIASRNPLILNSSPQAPLQNNLSLKEKIREDKAAASVNSESGGGGAALADRKPDYDAIERACRAAAGLENDPSPGLFNLAPIVGLIDAGADLERDILPAIRVVAKRGSKGRSWSYYLKAVREAMAQRQAAGNGVAVTQPLSDEEIDELWRKKLEWWDKHHTWPFEGADPETPGCAIPERVRAQWARRPTP